MFDFSFQMSKTYATQGFLDFKWFFCKFIIIIFCSS